jgi:hypothetical protein
MEMHTPRKRIRLMSIPSVLVCLKESHSPQAFLDHSNCETALAGGNGRPLGTAEFVTGPERLLFRHIARRAPGCKPTASVAGLQLKLLQ